MRAPLLVLGLFQSRYDACCCLLVCSLLASEKALDGGGPRVEKRKRKGPETNRRWWEKTSQELEATIAPLSSSINPWSASFSR